MPVLLFREMGKISSMILPMLAVESGNRNFPDRRIVQTAYVDTVTIGVGSRNVKRFNAAYFAKQVLGNARIECVARKIFSALQQDKSGFRNDEVKIAGPAAH